MTIQKADPSSLAVQVEITEAVVAKVADEAVYTISFGRNKVSAVSAKGAEELYAQCVVRNLCPEIELLKAEDRTVGDQWITDCYWRATWRETGQTYTLSSRGAEPYTGGAGADPLAVVPRKSMGKATRNAQLKVIPAVITKTYINHVQGVTGRPVFQDEEYAQQTPENNRSRNTTSKKGKVSADPNSQFYDHARSLGLDPANNLSIIANALGGKTVPEFLETNSLEEAKQALENHLKDTQQIDMEVNDD